MQIAKGAVWSFVVVGFLAVIAGATGAAVIAAAFLGGIVHTVSGG